MHPAAGEAFLDQHMIVPVSELKEVCRQRPIAWYAETEHDHILWRLAPIPKQLRSRHDGQERFGDLRTKARHRR